MKIDTSSNLAFLDTLSCGLGALMILFFIFAALNDEGIDAPQTAKVEISGNKPLPIKKYGTDKELAPILFAVKLESKNCKIKNSDPKLQRHAKKYFGLSNKEEGNTNLFFGSIWNNQNSIEVQLKGCEVDKLGVEIIEKSSNERYLIADKLIKNGNSFTLNVEFNLESGSITKINKKSINTNELKKA